MANINDFNKGTTINGATAYLIQNKFNGQIVFDGSIQPATQSCMINFADETKCIVYGTFCNVASVDGVSTLQLPDATKKGADVRYIVASKEVGYNKGFDTENNNIHYYYIEDGNSISVMYLQEGLKFWIKSNEQLAIGDLCCNAYDNALMPEACIKKAVAGDTAFLLVEQGCEANGMALVVVMQRQIVA